MSGLRPISGSPHLVALIAETERLAAAIAVATPTPELVDATTRAAVLATLRLDGSPLTEPPSAEPTSAEATAVAVAQDTELTALEYRGAWAGLTSDDLVESLVHEPVDALASLHGRLTAGLVAPEEAGTLRRTEQAVHDGSIGRILYFTPEPDTLPREVALVAAWLTGEAAREHALVVSGVLHLELLRLHPFEAANGRLARTAARLVLRGRGLDPDGLAAPEPVIESDPLGYHEEVARTLRRRDPTIWLERWGEAVTAGLRASARALGLLHPTVPDRAVTFARRRDEPTFTVADYRADVNVGPEDARADLAALLDAALIARVPASRGLRFIRHGTPQFHDERPPEP